MPTRLCEARPDQRSGASLQPTSVERADRSSLRGGPGDRLNEAGERARRPAQAIVVAQRRARVVVTEQTALAQDWHDLLGEDVEATGQPRRHDVEAVSRAVLEPGLDVVG